MKFSKQLTLMALAAAVMWSTVPALAWETAPVKTAPQQAAAPDSLKAESLDDTKPNAAAFNDAAKAVNNYLSTRTNLEGDELRALEAETMRKLEDAFRKDEKSIPIRAWLGYLNNRSGNYERAAQMLEPAAGKSADAELNLSMYESLVESYQAMEDWDKYDQAFGRLLALPNAQARHYFTFGSRRLERGQADLALEPLIKASQMSEGADSELRTSIQRDLGIAYVENQKYDEALTTFEGLDQSGYALDAEVLSWMGFRYLENGTRFIREGEDEKARQEADKAISVLDRARAKSPDNPDVNVLTNLANAYERRGGSSDLEEAVRLHTLVKDMDESRVAPWYNIGTLYVKMGRYQDAIEPLSRAIQLAGSSNDPLLAYAHNNLGFSYDKRGDSLNAARSYAAASDMKPDEVVFARNAGMAYFKSGDQTNARKYVERAERLGASDKDFQLVKAELNMRGGGDREALSVWEAMSDTQPDNPDVWFNIGVVRHRLKDLSGAESAYRKALELRPDDPDTLNNLGLLLYDQQKYTEALELFQKISSASPNSVDAKVNLGAALLKAGRKAEAIQVWKEVVKANPNNTKVRSSLADGLWSIGDKEGARFHYATILKSEPNNARALNGMGLFYLDGNKSAEAESHFRKAIAASPNFVAPYNNLAVVLERKNKVAEAILLLEKALKIDPNFEEGKKTLNRLKSLSNG